MFVLANAAFAQRTIDWSVDEIISPTQLASTASNTTAINVQAVLKLVSGDSAYVGDTVGYQTVIRNINDQVLVAIPNGTLYVKLLTKNMGVGDTMHLNANYNLSVGINASANIKLQVSSLLINRGTINPISLETTTNANNLATANIIWYDKHGWGVGVEEVAQNGLSVYPNPASSLVKVSSLFVSNSSSKIKIVDLQGRVVLEKELDSTNSVDVSSLNAGMYVVEVVSGDIRSTEKLQIVR
ncbi:MAG: T9SS type A sorting domain-containing protein [Flavobacteriales bacterium]|nr:T9SS type A sorting domain-containing protein [Flavobacteriales bacterium]